jgi:hypothetical protein
LSERQVERVENIVMVASRKLQILHCEVFLGSAGSDRAVLELWRELLQAGNLVSCPLDFNDGQISLP